MAADGQDHDVSVPKALYGSAISRSIVTEAVAVASKGALACTAPTSVVGPSGRAYISTASVALRWNYDGGLQTYAETFIVVDDCAPYDAVLRRGVTAPSRQGAPVDAHPYHFAPQSKGEKAAAEKRDKERREKYRAEVGRERQLYRDAVESAEAHVARRVGRSNKSERG